jgi:hypothetical protein
VNKRQTKPLWQTQGQFWADQTQRATKVVRGPDRVVRFTLTDWPLEGQLLGSFEPQEVK